MKHRLEEPHQRKYTINDALFSVRRCIGTLALLEDHCGVKTERCRNCVEKHLQLSIARMSETECEIHTELNVLRAEEYGREATTIKSKSKPMKYALERVPGRLRKLASVYYTHIGNKPANKRRPSDWWAVGACARSIRRWMQNTFNISKVAHGTTLKY